MGVAVVDRRGLLSAVVQLVLCRGVMAVHLLHLLSQLALHRVVAIILGGCRFCCASCCIGRSAIVFLFFFGCSCVWKHYL